MTEEHRIPRRRRIGPAGTAVRVTMGIFLLYLALVDGGTLFDWELEWRETILGLVVFPAVMMLIALVAGRYSERPLRFMGPLGFAANTALIAVLLQAHQTHDAALLFYGVSFPIAAWRDLPGCEMTVISNLALNRDDQIGCPVVAPVDAVEGRLAQNPPDLHVRRPLLSAGVCLAVAAVLVVVSNWM